MSEFRKCIAKVSYRTSPENDSELTRQAELLEMTRSRLNHRIVEEFLESQRLPGGPPQHSLVKSAETLAACSRRVLRDGRISFQEYWQLLRLAIQVLFRIYFSRPRSVRRTAL